MHFRLIYKDYKLHFIFCKSAFYQKVLYTFASTLKIKKVIKTQDLEKAQEIIKFLEDNIEGKCSVKGKYVLMNISNLTKYGIQTVFNLMTGKGLKVEINNSGLRGLIIKIEI